MYTYSLSKALAAVLIYLLLFPPLRHGQKVKPQDILLGIPPDHVLPDIMYPQKACRARDTTSALWLVAPEMHDIWLADGKFISARLRYDRLELIYICGESTAAALSQYGLTS